MVRYGHSFPFNYNSSFPCFTDVLLTTDIRTKILEEVLRLDPGETITPHITQGTRRGFNRASQPTYTTSSYGEGPKQYAYIPRHDSKGFYSEMRLKPTHRPIDATCLRTCKQLYKEGSKILYGLNTFEFEMANVHVGHQADILVESSWGILLHPNPNKPGLERFRGEIKEAIKQVEYRRPLRMLSGWVFHDPFLRFLHAIGTRNAALIHHLVFSGTVKLHSCRQYERAAGCEQCSDDLARSMRFVQVDHFSQSGRNAIKRISCE